jgi:glycosyltransferase involved in cell wall biosynthesis
LVGDPYDVLGAGGLGLLARGLRRPVVAATRRAVRGAAVVGYVTARSLQLRYPAQLGADSFAVSDITLTDTWFGSERAAPANEPPRLFLCGSLAQRYKGVDLMLGAMALMRRQGMSVAGAVAGDGVHRAELEEQAQRLGLGEAVTFLGAVSPDGIREQLDRADLFVMPSRTEGMPRALIEAMARGLPAVGSNVGGITELLDDAERFPREDVEAFAAAATRLLADTTAYARQSARNLALAKGFAARELAPRRQAFYRAVLDKDERGA